MPKKIEWINGNKMKFESAHKMFNMQTNIISTGNIVANTEYGGYIRAHNNIKNPYGAERDPGVLQDFDLNIFKDTFYLLPWHETEIKEYLKEKSGILYCFHHVRQKDRGRIIDAFVLTDTDYFLLDYWTRNYHWRAENAISEAIKYVSNGRRE